MFSVYLDLFCVRGPRTTRGRREVISESVGLILGWGCVFGSCGLQMVVEMMRIRTAGVGGGGLEERKWRTGTVPSKPGKEECQEGDEGETREAITGKQGMETGVLATTHVWTVSEPSE